MDSRLRGNDDERGRGGDAGITKRESVCDNVLDVPAGQWIPARKSPTKIYNFCGV